MIPWCIDTPTNADQVPAAHRAARNDVKALGTQFLHRSKSYSSMPCRFPLPAACEHSAKPDIFEEFEDVLSIDEAHFFRTELIKSSVAAWLAFGEGELVRKLTMCMEVRRRLQ